jgi:histidine triad (HIT) family protein
MTDSACLFCKIAAGQIPAALIHQDERLVAFRDINPQAPVHVLVIPRAHVPSLAATDPSHVTLLGEMLLLAAELARSEGLPERGYRTVVNTGKDGGQTVHHLHLHLLGGRALGWPPG